MRLEEAEKCLGEGDYQLLLPGPTNKDRVLQSLALKSQFPSISGEITHILTILNTNLKLFRECRSFCNRISRFIKASYGDVFEEVSRVVIWQLFWKERAQGGKISHTPTMFPSRSLFKDFFRKISYIPTMFPSWSLFKDFFKDPAKDDIPLVVETVKGQLAHVHAVPVQLGEELHILSRRNDCLRCQGTGEILCEHCGGTTGKIPVDQLTGSDLELIREIIVKDLDPGDAAVVLVMSSESFKDILKAQPQNINGVPCPRCFGKKKTSCFCVTKFLGQVPSQLPKAARQEGRILVKLSSADDQTNYCWCKIEN